MAIQSNSWGNKRKNVTQNMIADAIVALKNPKGSTAAEIQKYLISEGLADSNTNIKTVLLKGLKDANLVAPPEIGRKRWFFGPSSCESDEAKQKGSKAKPIRKMKSNKCKPKPKSKPKSKCPPSASKSKPQAKPKASKPKASSKSCAPSKPKRSKPKASKPKSSTDPCAPSKPKKSKPKASKPKASSNGCAPTKLKTPKPKTKKPKASKSAACGSQKPKPKPKPKPAPKPCRKGGF